MITTSGSRIRAVLLDIQGTLLSADDQPYPGAAQAVSRVRELGIEVRFVTNVDSALPDTIAQRLEVAGIEARDGEVLSPVSALVRFLEQQGSPRCHLLVPDAIECELERFATRNGRADYVVVGDCRAGFTWERLNAAFRALRRGAELVALQRGRFFGTPQGELMDTGAFVAALEYASGVPAHVVGKPSSDILKAALDSVPCDAWDALVVGDDVTTDVRAALTVGARSALVRTGAFSLGTLEQAEHRPDIVLDSIADLPSVFAEL